MDRPLPRFGRPASVRVAAAILVLAVTPVVSSQAPGHVSTGFPDPAWTKGPIRTIVVVTVAGDEKIIVCAGISEPNGAGGVRDLEGLPQSKSDGNHPDTVTILNDATSGRNPPDVFNRCWMAVDGTSKVHVLWGAYHGASWQQFYNWWLPNATSNNVGTPVSVSQATGALTTDPTTAMDMAADASGRVWIAGHVPISIGGSPVQGAGLVRLAGGAFSVVGPPQAGTSIRNLSLTVDASGYVHTFFVNDSGQIRHRVFAPDANLGAWVNAGVTLIGAANDPNPYVAVAADPVAGPNRGWVDCLLVTRSSATGPRQYRHRRWFPSSNGTGTWGPAELLFEERLNGGTTSDDPVADIQVDDAGTLWFVHRDGIGNQVSDPLMLSRKTSAGPFELICANLDDDGGFGAGALWNPVFVRGAPGSTGPKPLHVEWRKGPAGGPYQLRYFQGPHPVTAAPGDIVINEISYDDDATDTEEFVELYNAGAVAVNLQNWTLSNEDLTGPAAGSPVVLPNVTLGPGQFFVVGNTGVPGVNLVMPSNWLENNNESVVLRHAVGAIIDAVGYEVDAGPVPFREGVGIWGDLLTSTSGSMLSHARWVDGRDTQDNGADFGRRPRTPGASNQALPPAAALPYAENFDGLAIETPPPGWRGSLALPKVVDPTVVSASLPNTVPASPQGGRALALFLPANNGSMALLDTVAGGDFDLELLAWLHVGHIGNDIEEWSIGIRGTSDGFYRMPVGDSLDRNGNAGYSFSYRTHPSGGELRLVAHGSGGFLHTQQTVPVTAGNNDGWQRLRLASFGPTLLAEFGGTMGVAGSGVVFTAPECLHPARIGQVYLGYRSTLASTASARPLLVDGVSVSVPPSHYQVNQPAAFLDVNGIQGTAYSPAIAGIYPGSTSTLTIGGNPGAPFDGFISVGQLVPSPNVFSPTPGGQLINVALQGPGFWFAGGPLPTFQFILPAGIWVVPVTNPGLAGLTLSLQVAVLDLGQVDGVALTQGVQMVFQ